MQASRFKRLSFDPFPEFDVRTERLTMRPLSEADLPAFHEIAGQKSVARMLVNLAHPLEFEAAKKWVHQRRFRGRLGFMVGIFDDSNTLVGAVGLGGISTALVYFFGVSARRKGYASEALPAFLDYCQKRFALKTIFAGVFTDNDASRKILERNGFAVAKTSSFQSPARDLEDEIWEMECSFD